MCSGMTVRIPHYFFFDDQWLTQIIYDLGVTLWRNEPYPNNPVDSDISTDPQGCQLGKTRTVCDSFKSQSR